MLGKGVHVCTTCVTHYMYCKYRFDNGCMSPKGRVSIPATIKPTWYAIASMMAGMMYLAAAMVQHASNYIMSKNITCCRGMGNTNYVTRSML